MTVQELKPAVEALLMASDQPLDLERLARLLEDDGGTAPKPERLQEVLGELARDYDGRGIELVEVASGYRFRARAAFAERVGRLWEERKPRYSRALLETLAIIAYRQPITRGEIEEIRGVSLSPNILKTLMERGWVREVGVKEVPGRPALLGTTPQFLDDFNLKSLDELPSLPEIKDPQQLEAALLRLGASAPPPTAGEVPVEEPGAEQPATVH